jgi:hypothetical protein
MKARPFGNFSKTVVDWAKPWPQRPAAEYRQRVRRPEYQVWLRKLLPANPEPLPFRSPPSCHCAARPPDKPRL